MPEGRSTDDLAVLLGAAGEALSLGTGFQDRERSPHDSLHGLYRDLILAHGERITWPRKCGLTREYRHTVSLLIMDCF
jgi:hypothetical protein